MWGVNKLLTAVAVGLCFLAGLIFSQGVLLLLSLTVALGAYGLEHYLKAQKDRELLTYMYTDNHAERHHDALVQAGIVHEPKETPPAPPLSLSEPVKRTSY